MRIAILVPATETVTTAFMASMTELLMHTTAEVESTPIETLTVQYYGSSILPFSRQILAQFLVDMGFSHGLFIDSDMRFPKDTLLRLVKHEHPIVGINAMTRRAPYRCTAQVDPGVPLVTTPESTGLQRVSRIGFGLTWVAAEIFEKIERPWFGLEWIPEKMVFRGEDYWFCERAKAAGYDIWVDHDLSKQVFHVGSFEYSPLHGFMMDQLSMSVAGRQQLATEKRSSA